MPTYDIYFDSRDRVNGSPWDATFQLTHPLSNVRSVYCKSFQFQNTFQNITSTTNQFELNTLNSPTIITIPPAMYTATSILQKLNELMAPHGTVSLSGNLLSWNTRYGVRNISTTTWITSRIQPTRPADHTVLGLFVLCLPLFPEYSTRPTTDRLQCWFIYHTVDYRSSDNGVWLRAVEY